jgi:hypothetical protein
MQARQHKTSSKLTSGAQSTRSTEEVVQATAEPAGTGNDNGIADTVAGSAKTDTPREPVLQPDAARIDFGAAALANDGEAADAQPAVPMAGDPWSPVITRPDGTRYEAKTEAEALKPSEPPLEKAADEQTASTLLADPGIPDTHKSVAPVLAAHPDRDLILCLAGCGGGTSIVEIRRRPLKVAASTAQFVPASGGGKPQTGDIICLAGCVGRVGEVVYRDVRLSWIDNEGSSIVKAALRAIADRVIAREGLDIEDFPRNFMTANASAYLTGEQSEPYESFGFASPRIAAWMREQALAENVR